MKRDFRYIIKRVIIGILIGLFFIMFKSCNVNAASYINGNVSIDYYYQNCTKQDLTLWQCDNSYIENVSGPISFSGDAPVINSNIGNNISDYDKVLTRVVYTFEFNPIEVGNNCSNYNCNINLHNGQQNNLFFDRRTDTYVQLNTSIPHTNASNFNNFFVNTPYENLLAYHLYYADYYDSDLEEWKPLSVSLSTSMYLKASNWTNGQHISKLRFYLGSPSDLYYMVGGVSTSNPYVPVLPNYYEYLIDKYNENKYSNYQLFALPNATWVNNSNSAIFPIAFYPKGVNISVSSYTRRNYSIYLTNNDSGTATNIYDFTSSSLNDKIQNSEDNMNNLTNEIENSLSNSQAQEEIGTQFDPNEFESLEAEFSFFNEKSYPFTGLFSSLFVRPLALLSNQANIDLVNPNSSGNLVLDRELCNRYSGNPNSSGLPGGGTDYEVELWRGYKFKIPCMHVDVYPLLKHTPYGFYGSSFLGVPITGHEQVLFSFANIWLLIQHGILAYLMFVSCLNMYKYMLDSNKTEVEVLEL